MILEIFIILVWLCYIMPKAEGLVFHLDEKDLRYKTATIAAAHWCDNARENVHEIHISEISFADRCVHLIFADMFARYAMKLYRHSNVELRRSGGYYSLRRSRVITVPHLPRSSRDGMMLVHELAHACGSFGACSELVDELSAYITAAAIRAMYDGSSITYILSFRVDKEALQQAIDLARERVDHLTYSQPQHVSHAVSVSANKTILHITRRH